MSNYPIGFAGPRDTYRCACVSADAAECARRRYHDGTDDNECDCPCHYGWDDEGDSNG